ncbi:polysaccharide biosynthesis tyrosine autokinase [Nostoc sp. FACHB-152]|uniref:GumC family protein n=1 Tax=unclassified Nostoc TaxID=2593658 RepID=UPI001684CF5E|nr:MULTISPECIES: polysaccharide biosynthesis tyrosine autokinase [unclassified Nostoc]MBD2448278.1 polysaccharide biosynthesis tyrosine autokinase [Nostoc sp. FACHB-152]MBD2467440.1 polysaccharide biosynthesis tyrosine autokinase [Nostoc sp. FACHB-145]
MLNSEKYPYLSQPKFAHFNNKNEDELDIRQFFSVLRRRVLLISGVTAVVVTVATPKEEKTSPVYVGAFEILTKPITKESKVIASAPQTIPSVNKTSSLEISNTNTETAIKVLRSPQVIQPIVDQLKSKYRYIDYDALVGDLVIKSSVPNILNVQYASSDQKLADEVSKLLADAYLQYSLKETQLNVNQAIEYVNKKIKSTQLQVNNLQKQLHNLQTKNNLIAPAQRYQELTSQVASLQQQQRENRLQLEELVVRYQDLQKELAKNPGERASNSLLTQNVRYQQILDRIQAIDIEIAQKSAVYLETHPEIIILKEKKAYLLPLLTGEEIRVQGELQSQIRSLSARDQFFDEQIKTLNQDINNLVNVSHDYDNIQQQLQIAKSGLAQYTAKQQELEIEKSQKQQPWVLLDQKLTPVNQPAATSESGQRNLAIEGALGLLLGIGAALVVDKLSNIFYSAQELKKNIKLPLLGTVPLKKELNVSPQTHISRRLQKTNRASLSEIFYSLYTKIMFLGSDDRIRSLVISSAGQGDGKSTVAVHLAQAAAAMGQRVLLVDANLRCPSLHHRLGILNVQGLTEVISQDLDWQNIIERSPIEENLYVMTSGVIPPDSVRLLASQKMQHLMYELQANFDLVIYDTPSLLGLPDAHLLASNTNGMLLVAGLGQLKRNALKQVLTDIEISGTPLLGMIANKSKDATPVSSIQYQQHPKQNMSVAKVDLETKNTSKVNPESTVSVGVSANN